MVRWKARAFRAAVVLGALASLAIASGAGARWGNQQHRFAGASGACPAPEATRRGCSPL